MALSGLPAPHTGGFDINTFLISLDTRLRRETERLVPDVPVDGLLSLSLRTPELAVAQTCGVRHGDLYWGKPASGLVRIGLGQAFSWEGKGLDRWSTLTNELKNLGQGWLKADPDKVQSGPLAFIGLAFDPEADPQEPWEGIPNSILQIPDVLYTRQGSDCHLTFTLTRGPDIDLSVTLRRWHGLVRDLISRLMHPTNSIHTRTIAPLPLLRTDSKTAIRHWSARVEAALDAIQRAEFEKVVLTRMIKARAARTFNLGRMLDWLETSYPDCIHFAIPLAGRTLVGVTPERLVSVRNGTAITDAIAGTRPQQSRHPQPDEGNNPLFEDLKTRREQRLVVDGILRALKPVSHDLITVKQPLVLTLPNVQHLWSPIRARIRKDITLFDLAERLHPTPAVSGTPRDKALLWLKNQGEHWRGWYTGALGWATLHGEGELAVTLRCALLEDNEATLFAGAGIIRGSDPQQEFLETEWKLQSMLEALAQA